MRLLRWVAVLLLLLACGPRLVWGQAVSRQHLSLVNPLEFGESCTTATLTATIAAAPAGQGVLMITPVNRAGAVCTWAITSNLTIPSTLVLHVPNGAVVNVSAGVTLTLNRCPRIDNNDWQTGAGTIAIVETPCGGGELPAGTGDLTDIWTCTTGDCSALTAASGDTFDAGAATSSKPATRSTSLPATCTEGQWHQDTDSGGSETYVCTAANTWAKLAASSEIPVVAAGYAVNFTNQTTVTILGTAHGRGTADFIVMVKDNSTPRAVILPQNITVHDSTYDVVVTFDPAQSGRIILK